MFGVVYVPQGTAAKSALAQGLHSITQPTGKAVPKGTDRKATQMLT